MIYSASLTCADPLSLGEDVRRLIDGGIDTLHLDYMDGHHVPAHGLNVEIAAQLRLRFPKARLDAHLMVEHPKKLIKSLADVGVDWITIVPQTLSNPASTLEAIRSMGVKAGFAFNPNMEPNEALPLLPLADLIVVMSIQPGQYGLPFQDEAYNRIRWLNKLREENAYKYMISVDGGINRENSLLCRECGADILVLGIFTVFRQPQGICQASKDYIRFMKGE